MKRWIKKADNLSFTARITQLFIRICPFSVSILLVSEDVITSAKYDPPYISQLLTDTY